MPTTYREDDIDNGTDLGLQPTNKAFSESIPLLVDSCNFTSTKFLAPSDALQNLNFKHVVLITHEERLARIPPTDIVYSIMLNEPMNMSCAMDRISEIPCLNSSIYSPYFIFNLIGEYSMDENFLVDHICITCYSLADFDLNVFSQVCNVRISDCFGRVAHVPDSMNIHSALVDIVQPTKVTLPMLVGSVFPRIGCDLSYFCCLNPN